MRLLASFLSSAAAAVLLASCAGTECDFHSQCDYGYYCQANACRRDCQIDEDCGGGGQVCNRRIGRCEMPDGAVPLPDGGATDAWTPPVDAGRDAFTPPVDAGRDAFTPPVDSGGTTGTGRYLDRCTDDDDCASGRCVDDVGGSRFCSRACTGHAVCADEHVCDGTECVPDDTGRPCSVATPETCNLGLCLGTAGGAGACTRQCTSASDCPAGYACTDAGGGTFVCVDIEKPCSTPSDCGTGLCLSVQGCTSACRSAADCPGRLPGLPAYTCAVAFGSSSPICVPPSDVVGNQAAGDTCEYDGSGFSLCRSGACDDGAPTGPMCTQACTPEGGCGPGLGCFPLADGGDILLVCARAGSRALGAPCSSGRECDSGLCDATSSRCTRLCDDGLCPTGWTCEPVAGFGVNLCRP